MALKSKFPLITKKIPMKIKSLFIVSASITILCFAPQPVLAQLFGDEEKKWERVLMEMKKINSRLVSLKTKDVENNVVIGKAKLLQLCVMIYQM